MTNGEIVRYIVSLIFSMNGELENNLRNALANYSSTTQDEAMKLYIYYKAGVMDQIVANISSSSDQRDAFLRYYFRNIMSTLTITIKLVSI